MDTEEHLEAEEPDNSFRARQRPKPELKETVSVNQDKATGMS